MRRTKKVKQSRRKTRRMRGGNTNAIAFEVDLRNGETQENAPISFVSEHANEILQSYADRSRIRIARKYGILNPRVVHTGDNKFMLTFTPKMPRPTTEEADSFFRGRETAKVPVSVEEGVEVFFFDAQDDEDVHPNIDGVQYFIEEKFNGKSTFTEDEFQTIAAPAAGGKKAYRA